MTRPTDAERLDWLEAELLRRHNTGLELTFAPDEHSDGMFEPAYDFKGGFQVGHDDSGEPYFAGLREAIDAAMAVSAPRVPQEDT